jgi:hypothetical protein
MAGPPTLDEIDSVKDVGSKRFKMFQRLEGELNEAGVEFEELDEEDAYLYKLAQDFLTASATYSKMEKLEEIVEHVDGRYR